MATVSVKKDAFLFESGQPVKELYLILKGSCVLSFPGGMYKLSSGEIAGIYSIYTGLHNMSCRVMEDSTIVTIPVTDITSLETFIKESPDYSVLFLRSAFRQVNNLLQVHELSQLTCASLYADFSHNHADYEACCVRRNLTPVSLPGFKTLVPFAEETVLEPWSISYYDGFLRLLSSATSPISKEPAVTTGLIARACIDFQKVLHSLKTLLLYQQQILFLYLNENGKDLLQLYTDLYSKLGTDSPETDFLHTTITQISVILQGSPFTPAALLKQRMVALAPLLEKRKLQPAIPDTTLSEQLTGSLDTILQFAEMEENYSKEFKDLVSRYKRVGDKASSDDSVRELRLRITSAFYTLYEKTFFHAMETASLPLPVELFLYFGYVDEALAGAENLPFLYQAGQLLKERSISNVYTFYDWLLAIYNGTKEPCRNEFDEDYTDMVHGLKIAKKITAAEEMELLQDNRKKVEYELAHMFPSVNKVTFGRISAFCPIFSAHNLIKRPDAAFVSAKSITQYLSKVTDIDYSVFYREYVYTNNAAGIPKESLHTEVLPDIILMPNIGIRSVMWQEIEGKKRSTAARMMLSVFYLEDLYAAIVRLSGEYRWEMCKRIQSGRWNDVSERSLTSEYFDYVQFYKKNHELSADTKERIKSALQKARNSFKEMFVRDYITYIMFESTGSPRLTKPARNILFTYCPFSAPIRNTLKSSPIYKEAVERYGVQLQQQLRRVENIQKRVESSGFDSLEELAQERRLLER